MISGIFTTRKLQNHDTFTRFKYRADRGEITLSLEVWTKTYILVLLYEAAAERSVPVGLLQQRQHRLGVQLPPHEQVVGVQLAGVSGQGVTSDLAPLNVVGIVPWLHITQEVHHLGVMAVPVDTQQAKIHRRGWLLQY